MTVNHVTLPDGTVADGTDVICDGCGSPLANHSCGSSVGSGATVFVGRRAPAPRVAPTAAPTCAHCGGRLHSNGSAIEVNTPCLARQYALDKGLMSSPFDKIPAHLATVDGLGDIVDWAKSLATPPTYGKMESAAGGAGTYAGLKPKVGRRKKAVAAAPGSQIQDIADEEAATVVAEEKPKAKRSRKPKAVKGPGTPEYAAVVDEAASNGYEDPVVDIDDGLSYDEAEVEAAPVVSTETSAKLSREERAQRRRERMAAIR